MVEEALVASAESIESPRILALKRCLDAGDTGALERFWHEIEETETGTPLIEQNPNRVDSRFVTFLWKAMEPVDSVLAIHFLQGYNLTTDDQLERLGDTNLWYRTYVMRSDLRTTYRLAPNGTLGLVTAQNAAEWSAEWSADPLNKRNAQLFLPDEGEEPELESILELPDAPPQPWFGTRTGVPEGSTETHRFASSVLGNERDIHVYTPHDYDRGGGPYPLLVHFDAQWCEEPLAVPAILDNLIAAGAIPPAVAVFIANVDRAQELPCNERFAAAIATELLPWLRQTYWAGTVPASVVTAGQSYGGLVAMWVALQHPEIIGNVLSQSGSFWWGPDYVELEKTAILGDAPTYEWLTGQVALRPTASIRIWMEAGTMEPAPNIRGYSPTLFVSNRHMHHVLQAKGYDVAYREYVGGHDFVTWRGSLADGLIHLLG